MSNYQSQVQNNGQPKRIANWDDAIADAKQRLKDIQFALKVFEERKKRGEPWPIDETKEVTESQKAPAGAGAEMGEK